MQIRYDCPTDKCVAIIEYEPLEESTGTSQCPRCHKDHALTITDAMRNDATCDRCALCGGTDLLIRKDFPQKLGILIVVVFGALAIYYFRTSVLIAWSILAAAIVLDFLIYLVIGKVTTCYACRAQYRKCQLSTTHEGFDLATSEKY